MSDDPLSALAQDEEPTAPFWMATFSDMMTLLLAFFVMIVAMSAVEVEKFEEALSYFTGSRGVLKQEGPIQGVLAIPATPDARERARQSEAATQAVEAAGLAGPVEVDVTEAGVRLTLADSVAFAAGSVALDPAAQAVLGRVAAALAPSASVEVEGHTDDRPIATVAYPSNWELSAGRAAAVVRFLAAQPGAPAPSRFRAVGHGEHRPRASNETPEGRARNRRITVLFRTTDPDADAADVAPAVPSLAPLAVPDADGSAADAPAAPSDSAPASDV